MFEKITNFFKGVRGELARVTWPSRAEVISLTGLILIVVTILTIYIWGVDTVVQGLLRVFIQI
ncbi:MAG: preprotein translocase subunit SecE [Candidatus Bipolaricaulota bacterium]|nr:preprotein translocase subunit SecE [Candidatus Bipolaricaulota bacterium]